MRKKADLMCSYLEKSWQLIHVRNVAAVLNGTQDSIAICQKKEWELFSKLRPIMVLPLICDIFAAYTKLHSPHRQCFHPRRCRWRLSRRRCRWACSPRWPAASSPSARRQTSHPHRATSPQVLEALCICHDTGIVKNIGSRLRDYGFLYLLSQGCVHAT